MNEYLLFLWWLLILEISTKHSTRIQYHTRDENIMKVIPGHFKAILWRWLFFISKWWNNLHKRFDIFQEAINLMLKLEKLKKKKKKTWNKIWIKNKIRKDMNCFFQIVGFWYVFYWCCFRKKCKKYSTKGTKNCIKFVIFRSSFILRLVCA